MAKLSSLRTLSTLHGDIILPTFFPDATQAVVKGVDSTDLEKAGVEGLVINTYHLLVGGLDQRIEKLGGIQKLMNFNKPIVTDSGGFQVMSLVHKNPDLGKISDEGVIFKVPGGPKVTLTPEKSIQTQLKLGCDMAVVLDECTYPDQSLKEQERSVERTIAWAKRSKEEFERIQNSKVKSQNYNSKFKSERTIKRPLLFAVVQGGASKKLRKYCAKELIKIGFDGYCFGGFPVDKKGRFLTEILKYTAKLLPDDQLKYALGVGRPENIMEAVKMGYQIFDCVIPTREARHKKLYIFNLSSDVNIKYFYSTIYIGSGRYQNDQQPISDLCDCSTCQNYSRAYLHHLFKIGDCLAARLATIHNLRFYSMLMEKLK